MAASHDFYVVFARSGEAAGARGISAFIVDAGTPGFEIAERIQVIAPHPLARLRFTNCRVPLTQRIGAGGEGFKVAMRTLDVFRTSVAAAALGFARRALQEGLQRATTRKMFGQTLADFQLTQASLARMATTIDGAALLTFRAAWQRDQGRNVTREAAMAKLAATEGAQQVIDAALQLVGWSRRGERAAGGEALPRDPRAAHLRRRHRSAATHHRARVAERRARLNTRQGRTMQVLLPPGWPRPKGYSNGVAASGRQVYIAGMIGWDAQGVFHSDDFAAQARQALQNVVAVLREAGGSPEHIVRMTWYVTDKREYLAAAREVGQAFREVIGSYNAAMTAVEVTALMEDRAKVEIEATAVVPG